MNSTISSQFAYITETEHYFVYKIM